MTKLPSTTTKNISPSSPFRGAGLLIALSINSGICCVFCAKTFTEVAVLFMARMAAISSFSSRKRELAWVKVRMEDVWWMLWREMLGEVTFVIFFKGNFKMCLWLGTWVEGFTEVPKTSVDWICFPTFYMNKAEKNPRSFFDRSKHSFWKLDGFWVWVGWSDILLRDLRLGICDLLESLGVVS